MPADPPYFDTSYLVRLYLRDQGYERVRELAGSGSAVASAWHAQAEIVAAFHRAFREGRLQQGPYLSVLEQFINDSQDGFYHWLPLTESVQQRLEQFFRNASNTHFLRAADALHLACAAEHGYTEVYSNDRHFLAAAPLFGLQGVNVIPGL
jgi:predicted nucleic acid-binding protein